MADTDPARVAVYIDFDNIVISRYNQVFGKAAFTRDRARSHTPEDRETDEIGARLAEARVQIGSVLDYASSFGSIVISRAYADWSEPVNAAYQKDLVDRAVDLTQMFATTRAMKNGADIRLAVDVVEDLFRLPDLTHIVVAAGDSDYIALAQKAKRLGRYVVGIGVAGATSRALMAACDEFSDYDDLPGVVRPPRVRPEERATTPARSEEPAPAAKRAKQPARTKTRTSEPKAAEGTTRRTSAPPAIFSHAEDTGYDDADADLDDERGDPTGEGAQQAATDLLERALQLVLAKRDDVDWVTNSEVKNQMMRMDPAFTQKPLGYRSFSDFLASRPEVVEVRPDAEPDDRRLRLRSS